LNYYKNKKIECH